METVDKPVGREEAARRFLELLRLHGLKWTAKTPPSAYKEASLLHKVLTAEDCRALARTGRLP